MKMLAKKLVLSLVFAAIVVVSANSLYDTANTLLVQLKTAVKNAVETTLPELELLPAELAALGNAAKAPAETKIAIARDDIVKKINLLYPEAIDLGYIDLGILDTCIDKYQPDIEYLTTFVMREVEFCIENTIKDGDDLVNTTITKIKEIETIPDQMELKVESCVVNGTDECFVSVIQELAIEIVDAPATIEEETNKAEAVTRVLEKTFASCPNDRIAIMPTLGEQTLVYIRLCAQMPV